MLEERTPTLPFLCPRPSNWELPSRRFRFADRGAEVPFPLVVAECGAAFAAGGRRPVDIEGEGEEVEELIPFVCIPGGTGRLIFDSD